MKLIDVPVYVAPPRFDSPLTLPDHEALPLVPNGLSDQWRKKLPMLPRHPSETSDEYWARIGARV